jgi:hypothetical protein
VNAMTNDDGPDVAGSNEEDDHADVADGADGEDGEIVIRLSVREAEAFVRRFAPGSTQHPPAETARVLPAFDSPEGEDADIFDAVLVFDAAMAVLHHARVKLAAERQAEDVSLAAAKTRSSAEIAALLILKAASHARARNAEAVGRVAQQVADSAHEAAVDLKLQAQALADQVAVAASTAARTVAATVRPGDEDEAELVAGRLAAEVDAAAAAMIKDAALAAATVSVAVDAAATHAAIEAATAAATLDREAVQAAQAVHTITTAMARALALSTDARAVEVARVARQSHQP